MSRSIRIALTVGAISALAYFIDWQDFAYVFAQGDWRLLVPLLMLQAIGRVLEAYQLTKVIRALRRTVPISRVLLANALATFYGFILPGEILATVPKWMILSKDAGSRADILNAIVYNRLALLTIPLVIGSIALANFGIFDSSWKNNLLYAPAIGIILLSILLLGERTGRVFLRFFTLLAGRLTQSIRKASTTVATSFSQFHRLKLRSHLYIYFLSASVTLLRILIVAAAAFIVNVDVPIASLALAYCTMVVLAFFPLTLGNFGVREGILVAVLARYGVPPEQSVLLGFVLYIDHVLFAIVGGAFQLSLSSAKAKI